VWIHVRHQNTLSSCKHFASLVWTVRIPTANLINSVGKPYNSILMGSTNIRKPSQLLRYLFCALYHNSQYLPRLPECSPFRPVCNMKYYNSQHIPWLPESLRLRPVCNIQLLCEIIILNTYLGYQRVYHFVLYETYNYCVKI